MAVSRKFGEFVKSLAHPEDQNTMQEPESIDDYADGFQKAAERYFLPKQLKRLKRQLKKAKGREEQVRARLDRLERVVRGRSISRKREALLKRFIREAWRRNPNGTHREIAKHTDSLLSSKKMNFATTRPRSWDKYSPPVKFADVFQRSSSDQLLKLVKSYISKA
jgi:type VI protein secretion system component VasK